MAAPLEVRVPFLRRLADHVFFPVNMWLSEEDFAPVGAHTHRS